MRILLLLLLCFAFFVIGLYAGGFMAVIAWAMAATSFLLAID
jgi:hypothetical protein